jgi:hypothetical protein
MNRATHPLQKTNFLPLEGRIKEGVRAARNAFGIPAILYPSRSPSLKGRGIMLFHYMGLS